MSETLAESKSPETATSSKVFYGRIQFFVELLSNAPGVSSAFDIRSGDDSNVAHHIYKIKRQIVSGRPLKKRKKNDRANSSFEAKLVFPSSIEFDVLLSSNSALWQVSDRSSNNQKKKKKEEEKRGNERQTKSWEI